MMEQAVQRRWDRGRVAEQLAPILDQSLGRQERRGQLVAPHDDLQEGPRPPCAEFSELGGEPIVACESSRHPVPLGASPHLLETVYICQQRQEWFRDYARVSGDPLHEFIGSLKPDVPVVEAAATIRERLGFEIDARPAGSVEDALRAFIARAPRFGWFASRTRRRDGSA